MLDVIRCHIHVKAITDIGDSVGDEDGTSRTPLISLLPCTTLHYRALPCLALLGLAFTVLFREIILHDKL